MNKIIQKISLLVLLATGFNTFGQRTFFEEFKTLQKQLVPDKRVAILDISLNDSAHPTIIRGETDIPEAQQQLLQFLIEKGFSVVDSIRLLPDAIVGEKKWALATLSVSNLRAGPDHASELVSQALMGTPLKILDYKDGFYRVQTPEHYIGWMDASGLTCLTTDERNRWKQANRFVFNRLTGFVYDSPSTNGNIVSDLVLDNLFEAYQIVKGFLKIRIPDGRTGFVRKRDCISMNKWCGKKPDMESILSIAKQMNGFPYLWGGASTKTVDCSGFVKLAYYSRGIILARDASQQARYGEPVDFSTINNLQPGDLLFFGQTAQKIIHVGIYLGNGYYIHASGLVHINSIKPDDPKYNVTVKKDLVAARRIINSLNTEGIDRVENHPWYAIQ